MEPIFAASFGRHDVSRALVLSIALIYVRTKRNESLNQLNIVILNENKSDICSMKLYKNDLNMFGYSFDPQSLKATCQINERNPCC